jgi:hypothetical protein
MNILQSGLIDGAGNKFIDLGVVGACVIFLGFAVYLLVKYIKNVNQLERERLMKEADNKDSQVNMLYSEIKDAQSDYAEKLTDLLVKSNEMNNQIVIALNSSTAAVNNSTSALNKNSEIIGKLIDKL